MLILLSGCGGGGSSSSTPTSPTPSPNPNPTPVVQPSAVSLTLSSSEVDNRTSVTGTITLKSAALAGGNIVYLTSSDTTLATVPATVTVPVGASSAIFNVSAANPSYAGLVIINGAAGFTPPVGVTAADIPGAPLTVHGATAITLTLKRRQGDNDHSEYSVSVNGGTPISTVGYSSPTITFHPLKSGNTLVVTQVSLSTDASEGFLITVSSPASFVPSGSSGPTLIAYSNGNQTAYAVVSGQFTLSLALP